jgi:uncharacterized Tic20 family protein
MPGEPLFADVPAADRQWAMIAHLSALVAIWMGGMLFLGPLIVWLIKKGEMPFVDDQGKEALNFQLNMLILKVAAVVIGFPIGILTMGLGLIPLAMLLGALYFVDIIMVIVAAIEVNGGATYRYPFIIRIVV